MNKVSEKVSSSDEQDGASLEKVFPRGKAELSEQHKTLVTGILDLVADLEKQKTRLEEHHKTVSLKLITFRNINVTDELTSELVAKKVIELEAAKAEIADIYKQTVALYGRLLDLI